MKYLTILFLIFIGLNLSGPLPSYIVTEIHEEVVEEFNPLELELNIPNLIAVMNHYELSNQDVLLAQAVLETGWFKSYNCLERNNLFGLYDSKNKRMFKFNHWSLSVKGYKTMIQYRLREDENYYSFLKRIGYAEDPDYVRKLEKLIDKILDEACSW